MVETHIRGRGRRNGGPVYRDIDAELLVLIASGCSLDQIVERLDVPMDEVHKHLVRLRLVIEEFTGATSNN